MPLYLLRDGRTKSGMDGIHSLSLPSGASHQIVQGEVKFEMNRVHMAQVLYARHVILRKSIRRFQWPAGVHDP